MVINVRALQCANLKLVRDEISAVTKACASGNAKSKVIIETLTRQE